MPKITVKGLPKFVEDWVNDKVQTIETITVGSHLLSHTRDGLWLGRYTYPLAWKNRVAPALVLPDYEGSVIVPSAFEQIGYDLTRCFRKRLDKSFDKNPATGKFEWSSTERDCLAWPVAPVDKFVHEFIDCDLATLLPHTLPVLERWLKSMLRKYATIEHENHLRNYDQQWDEIVGIYVALGQPFPDAYTSKRLTAIAKRRFNNSI